MKRSLVALVFGLLGLNALQAVPQPAFPEFDAPVLKAGRGVWMGTCRECHANSLSDAPQVKDKAAWEKRIAKGKAALYESALKGRVSPEAEMPPRGGNPKLTDAEVRAAVDYMIAVVNR